MQNQWPPPSITQDLRRCQDTDGEIGANLQGDEERDAFDTVIATIHIISHEEVVCVRTVAANSEELHEVVELSMYVTTYRHWAFDGLHVRFLYENFSSLQCRRVR